MQLFSAWPVRCCLVGVAGFTLGVALVVSDSPLTAGQSAEPRSFFLDAQGEDRGSGRLQQPGLLHQAAIRGSGRISPTPPTPDVQAQTTAYRGSGRIDPHSPNRV